MARGKLTAILVAPLDSQKLQIWQYRVNRLHTAPSVIIEAAVRVCRR
jgi:hypothetical protein